MVAKAAAPVKAHLRGRVGLRLPVSPGATRDGRPATWGVLRIIALRFECPAMAPDDPNESRYAVGSGPINRRTAARALREADELHDPDAAPNAPVQRRVQQLRSRHLAGAPLAAAHAGATGPSAARLKRRTLALALAGTASLSASLFAPGPWGVGAALGLGAALWAGALLQMKRTARSQAAGAALLPPLVRLEVLESLDAQIERAVAELPEAALQALLRLKQSLTRVIDLANDREARQALIGEDAYYVGACAERYLPDALQAFAKVPALHREGGASQALGAQLDLMQQTLTRLETQLAAGASEALLKQQRFLQAKSRS